MWRKNHKCLHSSLKNLQLDTSLWQPKRFLQDLIKKYLFSPINALMLQGLLKLDIRITKLNTRPGKWHLILLSIKLNITSMWFGQEKYGQLKEWHCTEKKWTRNFRSKEYISITRIQLTRLWKILNYTLRICLFW